MEGFSQIVGMRNEELQQMEQMVPEGFRIFIRSFMNMDQTERERFIQAEPSYFGHVGDEAFLRYLDTECCIVTTLRLPAHAAYRVDLIDTWNMTRETVLSGVSGAVEVPCYGREYCAILAVKE